MSSPTARTLARCRKYGWPAQVVEKWVGPHAGEVRGRPFGRRVDLFGCIDVLAIQPGQIGCLGIQACAGTDAAKRLAKAREIPEIKAWLAAGNRFQVWAWRKVGAAGKRKLWEVRVLELKPEEG